MRQQLQLIRRSPVIGVWLLVLLLGLSTQRDMQKTAVAARPNVIIVMADDMGYGDVGCYNSESKIPTPNIDQLAKQGMRFTDAHSPSAVCTPTRYALLTGRYCWRSRLKRGVFGGFDHPLIEEGRMTIGSLFQDNGYATACIGKWHLGLDWTLKHGFEEQEQFTVDFTKPIKRGVNDFGFDYFFGTAACTTDDPPFCFIKNDRTVGIPDALVEEDPADEDRELLMVAGWRHEDADIRFAQETVKFIEDHARDADSPLFMYVVPSVPHIPWLPPDSTKGKSDAGPRGDQVVLFDRMVGQIDDALVRTGLAENTLLIITSDNGPREGVNGHASSGKLRGGKGGIYEGGHRVPFIVRWPGITPENTTCDQVVCFTDLFATFAGILGETLPEAAAEDSFDIRSLLRSNIPQNPVRNATIHHSGAGVFAIRQGHWKLIESCQTAGYYEGPQEDAPGQLYNLEDDPEEVNNLWSERPDIVERLTQLLERCREEGRTRFGLAD